MADIDPDLERRLQRLYQHIEAAPMPRRIERIDTYAAERSRRMVAYVATAAVAAVLSVALVVVGLSNHRANNPRPSAPAASAPAPTANPSGRPTAAPSTVPSPSPVAPPPPDPALTGGPVPSGFAPASVTFVSTRLGWALGAAPCAATNPCLSLLRTADGGATWARVLAPPAAFSPAPNGNSGVHSVRFADSRNGWVFSPELWATHDGGAHWTRVSLPGVSGGSPVARLEASAGIVHAAVFDSTGGTLAVAIETAAVGGEGWQRSPTDVGLGAGPVPAVELVLHGGDGWLIENDRGVVGGARYHNGHWTAWQPPCVNSGGDAALAASTATDLVAICSEGVWNSGPPVVHAYTSHDGGTTFQRSSGSLPLEAGGPVASGRQRQAVVTASSNGNAELLLTTDSGASTSVVYRGAGGIAADLGFTSADQGVVVEGSPDTTQPGGILLITHDGGRHWAPVTFTTTAK